jgi:hypothetical protein
MSQVRLSFEGTNANALAEILKGFPGCEVAVQVLDDGAVRGPSQEQIQKVIVTLTLLQQGADAGSSGLEFLKNLQEFQASPQAIERIVVIPSEAERSMLTNPSGEALVKAIEGELV